MFRQFMLITGLLFLASTGWAGGIDKSTSYSVEKDARTGIWTYECNATVKGIDRQGIYNGNIRYSSNFGGVISIQFVLGPTDRIYEESSEGVYEFQARLTANTFTIQLLVFAPQTSLSSCAFALGPGSVIGSGGLLSSHNSIEANDP